MKNQSASPLLQMKNIHLVYGGIDALKGVSFDLNEGEIHALVGEHGAGKSSLVKILSGAVKKSHGNIIFKGKKIDNFTPRTSIKNGIGMLYQEITILPTLNAVDNIFTGKMERTWYGKIKYPVLVEKAKSFLASLGVKIDINIPLKNLSREDHYMIELARVLSYDPEVIIFDEIANKLTPERMEIIYRLMEDTREKGRSVIYISHDMDEIFRLADRVTILKDGYRKGTEDVKDLDRIKLIKLTYSYVLSREELEQVNIKLHYFKKYNEEIIQNLPVGVIILDSENRIYMVNHAATHIMDKERLDIRNRSVDSILEERSSKNGKQILEKIRHREQYTWDELKYGKAKYLKLSTYPFYDEDHFFLGTILLFEDISKDVLFKEYLLRTEKITSIGELAAGVAHEINNPLSIIHNYIELLRIKDVHRHGTEEIEKIENEIQRIGGIVRNLLSFSKLNEIPEKTVNLAQIIDDVILLLNHKLKKKQIILKRKIIDVKVNIIGDESRLKQLLINLLINSIEAVLKGGEIEIELRQLDTQQYAEMNITDNGYGVQQDIIKNIFDPFFSTKAGKTNTGLGLAICQHIVELHQGLIFCKSVPGEKTVFTVRFPLAVYNQQKTYAETQAGK
jgi:two-component system sensor histidine kinase AtoS